MSKPLTLEEILGSIPNYIFDYLELSDDIKNEWRKGSKASDFGGHEAYKSKFKQQLLQWVADTIIRHNNSNPEELPEANVENRLKGQQRQILKDHGWKEPS